MAGLKKLGSVYLVGVAVVGEADSRWDRGNWREWCKSLETWAERLAGSPGRQPRKQ